jgi:hypothetical protein
MAHPRQTVARAAILLFTAHTRRWQSLPGDRMIPFPKENIYGYPDCKPSA